MRRYESLEQFNKSRSSLNELYIIKLDILSTFTSKGDSAYEVALDNGFEGSERDWLDSLAQPAVTAAETAMVVLEKCIAATERAEAAADAVLDIDALLLKIDKRIDAKIEENNNSIYNFIETMNVDGGLFN